MNTGQTGFEKDARRHPNVSLLRIDERVDDRNLPRQVFDRIAVTNRDADLLEPDAVVEGSPYD